MRRPPGKRRPFFPSILATVVFAGALAVSGGFHATAGSGDDPEITDVAGDANFISPIAGDERDTRPASLDNADLRAVWFETAYDTNKVTDPATGEVLRVEHVPTDLLVHIKTEGPIHPAPPATSVWYRVPASLPDCDAEFELVGNTASIRAVTAGCGASGAGFGPTSPVKPSIEGTVATLTFPLEHPPPQPLISWFHLGGRDHR